MVKTTPDSKVAFDGEFGIIEAKFSEEYSNVDPKYICLISKNFCLVFEDVTEKIHINKIIHIMTKPSTASFNNTNMV